jgi:excisionase family DNA binding protein
MLPVLLEHERRDAVRGSRTFEDHLLTAGEVAGTMRVSTMTVYRMIMGGELPAIRVGRGYRIRQSDVDRYLEERRVGSGS